MQIGEGFGRHPHRATRVPLASRNMSCRLRTDRSSGIRASSHRTTWVPSTSFGRGRWIHSRPGRLIPMRIRYPKGNRHHRRTRTCSCRTDTLPRIRMCPLRKPSSTSGRFRAHRRYRRNRRPVAAAVVVGSRLLRCHQSLSAKPHPLALPCRPCRLFRLFGSTPRLCPWTRRYYPVRCPHRRRFAPDLPSRRRPDCRCSGLHSGSRFSRRMRWRQRRSRTLRCARSPRDGPARSSAGHLGHERTRRCPTSCLNGAPSQPSKMLGAGMPAFHPDSGSAAGADNTARSQIANTTRPPAASAAADTYAAA